MKRMLFIFLFLFLQYSLFSQKDQEGDYIEWVAGKRLSVADFNDRKHDSTNHFCNATFALQYYKGAFSFKAPTKCSIPLF